jgi:XTP/dITP diphosphohydrolase
MTTGVPGAGTEPLWGRLRLVCASANPDKVAEIATILGDAVDLVPRPAHVPDVVEDADTLVGNARLKAIALVEATGMPAIADDTGLEVDALGGAPGVFTARFAGVGATYADNRQKLLLELAGVPEPERGARFVTVAIVVWPDGRELAVEGSCTGTISATERGERGFGYDAVFVPDDGDGRTFAEMSDAEKHALSHRGRAIRALVAELDEFH